jgi:uncharacterized membrane protein
VGSLVNIPLDSWETREVVADQVISYFGMKVRLPRVQRTQKTVLAINVGGGIIPVALSVYLLSRMEFGISLLVLLAIVTLVVNRLARPVRGLGIAVPGLIPPIIAALGPQRLYCQHPRHSHRCGPPEVGRNYQTGGPRGLHRRRRHL